MCGGVCKSLDERALFESVCLFVTLFPQQDQQQVKLKMMRCFDSSTLYLRKAGTMQRHAETAK